MTPKKTNFKKKVQDLLLPLEGELFLESLGKIFDLENKAPWRFSIFNHIGKYQLRDKSLALAQKLIEGQFENLGSLQQELEKKSYSLGIRCEIENIHKKHLRYQLKTLAETPELRKQILQIKKPLINQKTGELIWRSLKRDPASKIEDRDIQILCLSAFLTPLRQSVGSCFATAPAILVQKEQPFLFFQDLEDLLSLGLLKRTFAGQEHSIPLSPSWGLGSIDLPFVFTKAQKPWKSFEFYEIFKLLKWFKSEWDERKREDFIKDVLLEKINLVEGQLYSMSRILEKLLIFQSGMTEKEWNQKRVLKAAFPSLNLQAGPTSHKIEKYKQELRSTQLHLVQMEDHLFLKSWEYTLASFAESKSEFYKWNLYTSLGLESKEEGGISDLIYRYLEDKMSQYNTEIEKLNQEYEQEFYRVKYLEKRVQDTESERMATWARVEYQNHVNDLNRHLHARDELINKTNRLSKLLPNLVRCYDALFPRFFQELYDAQMHDYSQDVYEDSPAGFRLIYKHGRSDPSLWTFIASEDEFLSALKGFFVQTENEVLSNEELKDFEKEILEIGTLVVNFIYTEEFIQGAFQRICKRYKVPFSGREDFEKIPYKPWSYISGGTLKGLVKNYFRREASLYEEHKNVATPTELLAFLIDTVRLFPQKDLEQYIGRTDRSLLMYSPTHAFLFKPGWMPLQEIWEDSVYSFTWIRDHILVPQTQFVETIEVKPAHMLYFLETYFSNNPYLLLWMKENIQWPNYSISIQEFSQILRKDLHKIPTHISLNCLTPDKVEGWIYEFFPVLHPKDLPQNLEQIVRELPIDEETLQRLRGDIHVLVEKKIHSPFISASQLFRIARSLFILHRHKNEDQQNWPKLLLEAMRKLHLAMPKPLFFADTNWPYFYFAFLVNPSTSRLELWRVDSLGRTGFPMKAWDIYFQEEKPSTWSVLTKPDEYQAVPLTQWMNPV